MRAKVELYQEYLERIPAFREKRVPINIDEWAYSRVRPNLKNAVSLSWALHEMFRHTDIITMAAHAMGTSCLDITATDAAPNTVGLMLKLYRDHFETIPVEVTGNSPQPPPQYPVGGDQPKTNAGSDTYPLDVTAALTADGKALTVAVLDPTESAQGVETDIRGVELRGAGRMWRMTGSDPAATAGLSSSDVTVAELPVCEVLKTLSVAPISINIYEFAKR